MGMSLEELSAVCTEEPRHICDDRYVIHPEKSHPLFEGYVAWVSETEGLYYIRGVSRDIKTNGYGTEVKQEFSALLSPLERKYGKFKRTDTLDKNSLWYNENEWMNAIASGARTYEAHWTATEDNSEKFEGLITIDAGIKTRATYVTDEAYIWLEYGFANAERGFATLDDVL